MRRLSKGGGRCEGYPAYTAYLMLAALLLWGGAASAEEPKAPAASVVLCKASLSCLQQMVDDLRDYRQYLEDQLSLAKTLLGQANARIAQQVKEIDALKAQAVPQEKKP